MKKTSSRGERRKVIAIAVLLFLLLAAVGFAQVQSHPLSQVTPIDTNLNMGTYNITNVGSVRIATTSLSGGLLTFGLNSAPLRDDGQNTAIEMDATGSAQWPYIIYGNISNGIGGGLEWTTSTSGNNANNVGAIVESAMDSPTSAYLHFYTNPAIGTSGAVERMRIASNGNVGIGTTNPKASLDIGLYGPTWTLNSWGKAFSVRDGNALDLGSDATTKFGIGAVGSQLYFFYTSTANDTGDNANYFLTATNTGNVGIGTTGPGRKLEVNDAGSASNGFNIAYFGSGSSLVTAGNLYGIIIDKYGYESLMMGVNKNTATGSVPANEAYISTWNSNGAISIGRGSGGLPNTADIFVSSTGNVGIGTTNPQGLLHVFGTATTPTAQTYNGNLVVESNAATTIQMGNLPASPWGGWIQVYNQPATSAGFYNLLLEPLGGNVGIGTSGPSYPLDIWGAGLSVGSTAGNTEPYFRAGGRADNSNNVYLILEGYRTASGSDWTTDALIMQRVTDVTGQAYVSFYGSNFGIGVVAPGYTLDVAGAAHASSFPTSSDARFKTNVTPLTNVLPRLMNVTPVTFDWNNVYQKLGRATPGEQMGMIAQNVEQYFPDLVTKYDAVSQDGTVNIADARALDYGRFTAVLLEGIKEQQAEIQQLQSQNQNLQIQSANLIAILNRICSHNGALCE